MGTAAAAAQDTPDFQPAYGAISLDITMVGAITDQGSGAAASAGKLGRFYRFHELIIRFLRNRVAFIDQYGYHNLAGGLMATVL